MPLRPALFLHLHRGVGRLVHPDELVRLDSHQVADQAAERRSLSLYPLRLVNELSVNGLACAHGDVLLFVKLPEGVC